MNNFPLDRWKFILNQHLSSELSYTINIYRYQTKDYIQFTATGLGTNQAQNIGERTGAGAEIEVDYQPLNNLWLLVNYAYQKSEDDNTNEDVGKAPNHQVYARSEWQFIETWSLDTQVNWIGKQKRF